MLIFIDIKTAFYAIHRLTLFSSKFALPHLQFLTSELQLTPDLAEELEEILTEDDITHSSDHIQQAIMECNNNTRFSIKGL